MWIGGDLIWNISVAMPIYGSILTPYQVWISHSFCVISYYIAIIVLIIFSMPIVYLAPVGNRNRILDEDEKIVFGNRTRMIWLIETIVFLVLWSLNQSGWYIIIVLSVVVAGSLVSIGRFQEMLFERRQMEYASNWHL